MMDANELLEHAKKTLDIDDLEERIDMGHKILTGYLTSPKVEISHLEKSVNVNLGELPKQLLEKFKEKAEKGKKIDYNEQSDFLKKMADLIMPTMGCGVKDSTDMNYGTMMLYLGTKTKEGTYEDMVRDALKNGNAEQAKQIIIGAITNSQKQREQQNLFNALLPPDDTDLHYKIAEKFVSKYNKELEEAGIDKKVAIGDVAPEIHKHYMDRASLAIKRKSEYGKLKGGEQQ